MPGKSGLLKIYSCCSYRQNARGKAARQERGAIASLNHQNARGLQPAHWITQKHTLSPMSTPRCAHSTFLAASRHHPFLQWCASICPSGWPWPWPWPSAWPSACPSPPAWPSPSLFWRCIRVGSSGSSTGSGSFCEPRQRHAGASAQMQGAWGDGVGRFRWGGGIECIIPTRGAAH